MKKIIKTIKKHKINKRIISVVTALVLCFGCMPVLEMFNTITQMGSSVIVADAASYNLDSVQAILDYSQHYTAANANDTLIFSRSTGDTGEALTGFEPIGTDAAPFKGKIILSDDFVFNLPTTLFGNITDNVTIVKTVGGVEQPATVKMTRTSSAPGQPLFAQKVSHESGKKAQWSFQYSPYIDKTHNTYVYHYGGFIGEILEDADVEITSAVIENKAKSGDQLAHVEASGDVGLICGTIDSNAKLKIGSISIGSSGDNKYHVESANGNAGGLVGSMGSGSTLTLGIYNEDTEETTNTTNPQDTAQTITSDNAYAGGIVGKCDGGTVEFDNTAAYAVEQVIEGKSGSGGIAGYYSADSATIDTGKVSIGSSCKVNGTGSCGGLFGEVVNNGTITISGSSAVAPDHSAGAASSYGGLIGKYSADALADTLTISTSGTISPTKTGGTAVQYGGIIGEVSGAAYVLFDGVNASASKAAGTSNFGGLVGKAAAGFIELQGTNIIGFSGVSTEKTFGGVVGDIDKGVLYLQGTTNLSGTPAVTTAAASSGQVAGYRTSGLVFAADGWSMIRSNSNQKLDDIGSWGEVIRFNDSTFKQTDILDINSGHYVTIKSHVVSMSGLTDFAKTALNIQHNYGLSDSGVLRGAAESASSTLLGTDLSLSGSSVVIDLAGTGITGLTRDNGDTCTTYTGTFDGNGGTIKLAVGESYFKGSKTEGEGKIYRHKYIGLFGRTNGATIKNLTISSTSEIRVNALAGMHVGNIVGMASGDLTLDSVTVDNDGTNYATINNSGTASAFGGLVGTLTSAGTVNITGCTYKGEIKGSATTSYIGGLIGNVISSDTFGITVQDTTVSGKITAASNNNQVGGAIAYIDTASENSASSGRKLNLNGLTVSGLTMETNANSGGFLGQEWYKTDVEFKASGSSGVVVGNSSSLTTTSTSAAGLVHTATGYWKVNNGGISLASMSVTASSAESFGLLVNKGIDTDTTKTSLYLELLPGASSFVTKERVSLTMGSVTVFDELVAYSSSGDVCANGQGVVSIATTYHALLKMSNDETGSTYQHQTAFLDTNAALRNNSHTRYYYNLDNYRTVTLSDAPKLLMWSVYQYAHDSIKPYFPAGKDVTSLTGTFNMRGYSYYPVDLKGSLTISGELSLYNAEFDTTEGSTTDNRLSDEIAQHYLIHNGLLRNVSGTLNASLKLCGDVKKIGDYCGALVMGTVSSSASANPAKVTVNSLVIDTININSVSDYSPLLINKAGSNVDIKVENVSNTNANNGKGAGVGTFIASSLLGKIGTSTAENVNLTFSKIKLDGRNATGVDVTNLSGLTDVYNSKGSLFKKATLVDTLEYAKDSGSSGVYNYDYSHDWAESGTNPREVTYGAEIETTVENRDSSGSLQLHYNNDDTHYTNPVSKTDTLSTYGSFGNNFQRYVLTPYTSGGTTHELRVNIKGSTTSGCGTYNDPYMIKYKENGKLSELEIFANIINGDNQAYTISVPNAIVPTKTGERTWCADATGGGHTTYSVREDGYWYTDINKDTTTRISDDSMREYLAGAYYKIDPNISGGVVNLSENFPGISANRASMKSQFAFRGVIDGSGMTINNPTTNPLVVSSYGCVIRNVTINVTSEAQKVINQSDNRVFTYDNTNNSDFYGAVIGQIFGGDNIIDNVKVKFPNTTIINATGSKAYLVPIGGYVGVVVNGGLIFRDMDGLATSSEAGITASSFGSGFGESDPTADNNTKWLYVNPIIGRVLNGYAVTETDSYAPFEHGTRQYADSTDTGNKVTMHNGTKNYSIANISKEEGSSKFTISGNNITVSSAQALFIMSLITQSGLGKSTDGTYAECTHLTPYTSYMSTHLADYDYVGSSDLPTTMPTSYTDNPTTDPQKAANDFYTANQNDTYSGNTGKVPYIIKTYTPESSGTYPAFNAMGTAGNYNNLTLSGTDTTFNLPDSYRGLGSLMFGITATDNNLSSDTEKDVYLYSLDGSSKEVSLNMGLLVYSDDNYPTMKGTQATFKTGFGLINCLNSNYNNDASRKFKNLTIKGSVKSKLINPSTGADAAYSISSLNTEAPAVAAVAGAPVDGAGSGSVCFENIMLDSMDISGMCFAGGFVGALNVGARFTFSGCSADDLKVFAGFAAGGLAGYMRNQNAIIDADFQNKDFSIISIVSGSLVSEISGDQAKPFAGAGSLIGDRTSSLSIADGTNIMISNVTIRNGTSASTGGYIGCYKSGDTITNPNTVSAGGLIGNCGKTSILSTNNVTIENLNICGAYAGGMIGQFKGDYSYATIMSSSVTTDKGCKIESTHSSAGASGGFIGLNTTYAGKTTTITDSTLTGYKVSGTQNVGGLFGHNNTTAMKKVTNVTLSGHTISGTSNVGGLAGYHQSGDLDGYNILINNQTAAPKTEGGSLTNCGYIAGNNGAVIKIAGFSRQGTISDNEVKLVGSNVSAENESFGSGGYVIFADYGNKATTVKNAKFSDMFVTGSNVGILEYYKNDTLNVDYDVAKHGASTTVSPTFKTAPYFAPAYVEKNVSVSYQGTKVEYVENPDDTAQTVADITSTRGQSGFKLYCVRANPNDDPKNCHYVTNNVTDKGKGNVLDVVADIGSAAVWYMEPVENLTNTFKVYTLINNTPNYIKRASTAYNSNISLTTTASQATQFVISTNTTGQFRFQVVGSVTGSDKGKAIDNSYLSHSGGGKGIRFWYADGNNQQFKLYFVADGDNLIKATDYSTLSFDGSTITTSVTGTNVTDASRLAEYAAEFSAKGLTQLEDELWYIKQTVTADLYKCGDNTSPFVTTNPICDTVTTENTQWLTSDGVSYPGYNASSAAYNIVTDIRGGSANKRYQNTGISGTDLTELNKTLSSKLMAISSVAPDGVTHTSANGNLPVLVVDDIARADKTINNYLKVLTNTNYAFAKGYYDGGFVRGNNPDEQKVFKLEISKWKYDDSEGKYVLQNDESGPSLKCDGYNFKILPTQVDNNDWQFSLIDVQFFDPSDTSSDELSKKIAYHLYVPIVVKKMLYYDVTIRAASATTYKLDTYPTSVINLIENLGNPVTLKVTFTYQQEASDWEAAINSGENVIRNYDKKLDVTANQFPSNAQIVLVDPNNNADKHFIGNFTNSSGVLDPVAGTQGSKNILDLSNFSGFSEVKLNDIMNITVDSTTTAPKNLVECPAAEATCAVRNYYTDSREDKSLYLKYAPNATGVTQYAVKVGLKDNQNNGTYVQENYYLSIFTKADKTDTSNIYHYEISGYGTSFDDPNYPSAMVDYDTTHLYLGNLYTNKVTIQEGSNPTELSSSNNTISATLTASIGFTPAAVGAGLITNIRNNGVKIYQTFMLSLNRLNGTNVANQRGILVDPTAVALSGFKVNDSAPSGSSYSLTWNNLKSYIEMPNGYNIKGDLIAKAEAAGSSSDENDYTITVSENIALTYHPTSLGTQFPESTAETTDKGTIMIGYSNISPSATGGAASRASANTEETSGQRKKYYIKDSSPVEFSYNADVNEEFENDGNANYGQLGIDGNELDIDAKNYVQIKSAASYNIFDYGQKSSANYVRLRIKLSCKKESIPSNQYVTALDMDNYLTDFELLDSAGQRITQIDDDETTPEDESNGVKVYRDGNVLCYIIPKSMLSNPSPDLYVIPVNFKAFSGNNSYFEDKTYVYSNYKVEITAELLETGSTNAATMPNSSKTDHIIYTNAKLHSDVIEN